MTQSWFITGTDTGVGKTQVSAALLTALVRNGRRAVGMKPVASGCQQTAQGLESEDVQILRAAGNVQGLEASLNPYAFATATAPHLAAATARAPIYIGVIEAHYQRLAARAEHVVVEGIGGWLVPINSRQTMADVARALDLPVILVVDVRLGSFNHALLTAQAIAASGCRLVAWVANNTHDSAPEGYRAGLVAHLEVPLLGELPCSNALEVLADSLDLSCIGAGSTAGG